MKKILFLFLVIACIANTQAQTNIVAVENDAGKWGYINTEGDVIIEPFYDDAHNFCEEGMAMVFSNGKWDFIDKTDASIVLPFKSYEPRSFVIGGPGGFVDGLAQIVVKKKFGVVNTEGKVIYQPDFTKISKFVNGYAIGILDGKHYLLQSDGTKLELDQTITAVDRVVDGLAPYRDNKKRFGFINTSGEVVIQAQFKKVGYFYNDIAWARNMEGKIGFIDKTGKWIISPEFNAASDFDNSDEIARVRIEKEWMFLNKSGEKIKIPNALKMGTFCNGLAWVRVGDKFGYVNNKGEWIIEPTYKAAKDFEDGQAWVRVGDLWGIIDQTGKVILEADFIKFGAYSEGLIAVRKGSLWGYIDIKGSMIIEPAFKGVRPFSNNYAAARDNASSKWGIIDREGNWVIEADYKRVKDVIVIP